MSQTNGNRVYRPVEPSDLPKIQEGKLKVFKKSVRVAGTEYFPARLVSTNYCLGASKRVPAYLVDYGVEQGDILSSTDIVVDVTPEVRWIIWNLKYDRISGYMNENKGGWKTKGEADNHLYNRLNHKYPGGNMHPIMLLYKIVSFEV